MWLVKTSGYTWPKSNMWTVIPGSAAAAAAPGSSFEIQNLQPCLILRISSF